MPVRASEGGAQALPAGVGLRFVRLPRLPKEGKAMLPLEVRIRSAGRIAGMLLAGILAVWVLLHWGSHASKGPVVAPCPPQECVLHPHAPHGPGG